jgi:CRISPR-associated Csx2 family protein
MSKAFISILGTNDYLESFHLLNNKRLNDIPTKYVQEDLVKHFCKDWGRDSEVRIFLTDEARKKNWENDGHIDIKTQKKKQNEGLRERLSKLNYNFTLKDFRIPNGNSEEELWEIFEIILDSFHEGDEIIVDITHSFRFLPMLLTVMLNYTRQIKNITIKGVYYAAFETLGTYNEVKNMDIEKRNTPIFDITPLIKLQEWTLATFDFQNNANISGLKKITSEIDTQKKSGQLLNNTIKYLDQVSNNIALCRGDKILKFDYTRLIANLEEVKHSNLINNIKPMMLLVDVIKQKLQGFGENDFSNGLTAVQWALKHKLYQQAITILQEVIITKILGDLNLDSSNRDNRQIVSAAIKIKNTHIPEKKWKEHVKSHTELTKKILNYSLVDKIKGDFEKLSQIRNDVNHAGFVEGHKSYKSIIQKLNKIYENILQKLI